MTVQAAPPSFPCAGQGAIPNYGGRDSAPLAAAGDAAPNPAAQAGRALEALVRRPGRRGRRRVSALKRFGLVKGGAEWQAWRGLPFPVFGRPPSPAEAADVPLMVSSQTLPGGAMLHVVRVPAPEICCWPPTAHTVTNVAEWSGRPETAPSADNDEAFEDYLALVPIPLCPIRASPPPMPACARCCLLPQPERNRHDPHAALSSLFDSFSCWR